MQCPRCEFVGSKVLETRPSTDGKSIRRRRECEQCGFRFTTFETVELNPLLVIKKNGNREHFNRSKLLAGIMKAAEKRPVSMEQMNQIIDKITKTAAENDEGSHEVKSTDIGEGVMAGLKQVDEISYVRFASVYRRFRDMSDFSKLINDNKREH